MGIYEKLTQIQTRLKVPKNLYNSFGKYNYRNLEGILEAVKPFLAETKTVLYITDDIVAKGDRYYVAATASLTDLESGESVDVTALSREALTKKGMDDSQITGTASSYARKYALGGMFLLDDTKDADTDEYHNQTNRKSSTKAKKAEPEEEDIEALKKQKIGRTKALSFNKQLEKEGISASFVCKLYGVDKLSEMTEEKLYNANAHLKDIKAKQDKEVNA